MLSTAGKSDTSYFKSLGVGDPCGSKGEKQTLKMDPG